MARKRVHTHSSRGTHDSQGLALACLSCERLGSIVVSCLSTQAGSEPVPPVSVPSGQTDCVRIKWWAVACGKRGDAQTAITGPRSTDHCSPKRPAHGSTGHGVCQSPPLGTHAPRAAFVRAKCSQRRERARLLADVGEIAYPSRTTVSRECHRPTFYTTRPLC